jgi:DNA-directed RNA polymerase subunit N (RpoN/RPB10)
MIIPVRCFTCGKVRSNSEISYGAATARARKRQQHWHQRQLTAVVLLLQVIGNKWDTYLDLLQAEYEEG